MIIHYRIALGKRNVIAESKTGQYEFHLYQLNARGEAKVKETKEKVH